MFSNETGVHSYDAGHKPYNHDPKRGKWEKHSDFYTACFANAFGMRTFFMFSLYMNAFGGAYIIIPIVLSAVFYIIPVFFIQSFLGQFSSTGFISVFRISPIFKGIGYVILILNFLSAIYNSTIAAYPLLFFVMSFQLNTTWMYCDNSWNTQHCKNTSIFPFEAENTTDSMMPAYQYLFHGILRISEDVDAFDISWTVILGELIIWITAAYIVSGGIAKIGRFLRYTTFTTAAICVIIFIRICFLPEVADDTYTFFKWSDRTSIARIFPWMLGPMVSSTILGRGWGIVLTLASYQPFKSNLERYSYVIPLAMTGFAALTGYIMSMVDGFVSRRSEISLKYFDHDSLEYLFVAIPYFVGKLEASQMWSMLFFFMFFLSEMALIVIQTFSIVTAIVDECVYLRTWRNMLSVALCAISFIFSIFFAIVHLADTIPWLISSSYVSQMLICFLEIMMVVWIYGRLRFSRDYLCMLNKTLAGWKFFILRFITPILIIISGLVFLLTVIFHLLDISAHMQIFAALIKILPWILIPGYAIVKLITTIGTIPERLKRCIRPNDWYPADPVNKQRYDLALGTSDVSQQLLEMNDNCVP